MDTINKKILIVEDDEDFVFILEKKFTTAGFSVVTAHNGQEGIAAAEKEKPDLIISDMLMPKVDGMGMAKKIRETNPSVPIIFLTNIKDENYMASIKESDHLEYLIKSNTSIDDIIAKSKVTLGIA